MKIGIICFTAGGAGLCRRLCKGLLAAGDDCLAFMPERFLNRADGQLPRAAEQAAPPVSQWSHRMFEEKRAMIFIGAAGIAVRAIAPCLKDKMEDPPVVVVDEGGSFAVPILSGHVGGANELAERIGTLIGAVPVVTTATDVQGLFAVDVFAAKQCLAIRDRQEAKAISAALLAGEEVGFFSDFPVEQAELPAGLCKSRLCRHNIWITVKDGTGRGQQSQWGQAGVLRLVPKAVVLGIGCRRGISLDTMKEQVKAALADAGVDTAAVKAVASIDVKRDEAALLALGREYGWALRFFCAKELEAVAGDFSQSAFVKEQVGVGNVCERAACAGGGRLFLHKQAGNGVTVAAALEPPAQIYTLGIRTNALTEVHL